MADKPLDVFPQQGTRRLETRIRRLEVGEPTTKGNKFVFSDGDFRRGQLGGFLSDGRLDLTKSNVVKKGSTPSITIDGNFSATTTASSITIFWDSTNGSSVLIIRRPDNTAQVIPPSNITISGLGASTDYYFLPFFATKGCGIGFVNGDSGSPQIAFTLGAQTAAAAALQTLQDREQLSNGYMKFTTGAAQTSNGGSRRIYPDGCPRAYIGQVVESRTRGVIPVEQMHVGEHIRSPHFKGWVKVRAMHIAPQDDFITYETADGAIVEQSPETPQPMACGVDIDACDLQLRDEVLARGFHDGTIVSIGEKYVEDGKGRKVVVEMEDIDGESGSPYAHCFYCSLPVEGHPVIACHNVLVKW